MPQLSLMMRWSVFALFVLSLGSSLSISRIASAAEHPVYHEVQNLNYGRILYSYYQENYYEALTQLAMSDVRKKITQHGQQPTLLKAILYLSYGLYPQAKTLFEQLTAETPEHKSAVSLRTQTLAWFYLGKAFYQEGKTAIALSTLKKIDSAQLEEAQSDAPKMQGGDPLIDEYHYLMGTLLLANGEFELSQQQLKQINKKSSKVPYLTYNSALVLNKQGKMAESQTMLDHLLVENEWLKSKAPPPENQQDNKESNTHKVADIEKEKSALRDRIHLTQGLMYAAHSQFSSATHALEKVSLEGPLSDQALFQYALASIQTGEFAIAIQALQTLTGKQTFNPLVYESYFAVGYLNEKMHKDTDAYRAYIKASQYYAGITQKLEQALAQDMDSYLQPLLTRTQSPNPLMSHLFAKESFQLSLHYIEELAALKTSFSLWARKVGNFEGMIEARKIARNSRITHTQNTLSDANVHDIISRRDALAEAISEKSKSRDVYYFLNQEQKDNLALINKVKRNLSQYNNPNDTADYQTRLKKIEHFFYWQASENFPIQRWEAEKNLHALSRVLAELDGHTQKLETLIAQSSQIVALELRIQQIKPRLHRLMEQTSTTLQHVENSVKNQIQDELKSQLKNVTYFHAQSQLAQARLADQMLEASPNE